MIIAVSEDVQLEQVDDFSSFAVHSSHPIEHIDAQLRSAGLGYTSDDHAWISAEPLRARASAESASPSWEAGFDRMLEFAQSHGWWDAQHGAIRAHISSGA